MHTRTRWTEEASRAWPIAARGLLFGLEFPQSSHLSPGQWMVGVRSVLDPVTVAGSYGPDRRVDRSSAQACGWERAPEYLIHDRDRAYGEVFTWRVRAMGIRERPTSPRSPWQNDY